jgi:hypothetical protein
MTSVDVLCVEKVETTSSGDNWHCVVQFYQITWKQEGGANRGIHAEPLMLHFDSREEAAMFQVDGEYRLEIQEVPQ